MAKKIVILAGIGNSSNIVFNYISKYFEVDKIIFEKHVSKTKLLKRRIKNLGILTVIGQLLFQILASPILKWISKHRINEIKKKK